MPQDEIGGAAYNKDMNRNLWTVLVVTSLVASASAARAKESPESMKAFSGARFLENAGNGSVTPRTGAVYAGDARGGAAKARLIKANDGSRGGKADDAVVPAPAAETPGFWSRVNRNWRQRMREGHFNTDLEFATEMGGFVGAVVGGAAGGIGGAAACAPTVVGAVACGAGGAVGGGAAGLAAGAAVGVAFVSGVKYVGAVVATAVSRD